MGIGEVTSTPLLVFRVISARYPVPALYYSVLLYAYAVPLDAYHPRAVSTIGLVWSILYYYFNIRSRYHHIVSMFLAGRWQEWHMSQNLFFFFFSFKNFVHYRYPHSLRSDRPKHTLLHSLTSDHSVPRSSHCLLIIPSPLSVRAF